MVSQEFRGCSDATAKGALGLIACDMPLVA